MSRLLIALIVLSSFAAFAGASPQSPHRPAGAPLLLAMGPDPGGHTGAGVTPETTKTDRPAVDAARSQASGSNVENNSASSSDRSNSGESKQKR